MTEPRQIRYLSGVQPSGRLHLGNYFGAIANHIRLQDEGDCYYFIANYHAMTTVQKREELERYTFSVAADYLALGLDPAKALIFRQSDIPEVAELSWIFCCLTGMGLFERAHSYKDKVARGITPSVGLFTYPALMAADILIYQSHRVPVGQDQVQHVEITRDIAGYFHGAYRPDVFTLPEAVLSPTPRVIGLTGGKMSKSDDASVLPIFCEPAELKKRVMSIVTDSKGVEDAKDPETNTIYILYKLVASDEEAAEMESGFRRGGMGYGDAKKRLLAALEHKFGGSVREARKELEAHPDRVEAVLETAARKARRTALGTMEKVYEAVGIPRSKVKKELSSTGI